MGWSSKLLANRFHKYGAKKTEIDGITFDSKLEAGVYLVLKARVQAGEIRDLERQTKVHLSKAGILLKPDFKFTVCATGETMYAEAKGQELPTWRLKLRLWRAYGPAPLEIWKGTAHRPVLDDVVHPEGESK